MRHDIIEYLKSIGCTEQTILFLIGTKLNFNVTVDDDQFVILIKHNIVERDYNNNLIKVKIPLFSDDKDNFDIKDDVYRIVNINNEVENRVSEYRSLFRGIRAGGIGSVNVVKTLLISWLIKNKEYTFNDILKATEYYVSNEDKKFISNADNFIFSIDKNGNTVSKLLMVIEDIKLGTIEKNFN